MKLAREMDKLYEVERLTAFKATSTFMMMQNRGLSLIHILPEHQKAMVLHRAQM